MKHPLIGFLTIALELVIAVWASFFWKRSTFSQRCIIVLIAEIALSGIIEAWAGLYNIRNLWVIHFSMLLEFLIITAMFYGWKKRKRAKSLLLVLCCLFLFLWVLSKYSFEPFTQMDSYTSNASVFFIAVASSVFLDVTKDRQTVIMSDPRIWAAAAILIYSSGSLILVSLFNDMLRVSIDFLRKIWQINIALVIISTFLFARAIWCTGTKQT
jgi:hypothetical protein